MRLRLFALPMVFAACTAHAQLAPVDPDWRETDAPPPPAIKLDGLIPLDMPRSALRFGVDPASVSLGSDSIVRYVVVAVSATGAVNALYEGRWAAASVECPSRWWERCPLSWTGAPCSPQRTWAENGFFKCFRSIARRFF